MKNFISITDLKKLMNCSHNLKLIDVRLDYLKSHIPGALTFDVSKHYKEPNMHGGRHPIPDVEFLKNEFMKIGLSLGNRIICYDDGELVNAGRLWMLLRYLGFKKVSILIGGFKDWTEYSYEVTDEPVKVESNDRMEIKINDDFIIGMEEVRNSILNDNNAILIDSRSHERYMGIEEPYDNISGHIPKAINYPYYDLISQSKFPSKEDIENHFKDLKKYTKHVVYCGSGITATINAMLLEEIGFSPKIYAGSFSDWISYSDNKVERCV